MRHQLGRLAYRGNDDIEKGINHDDAEKKHEQDIKNIKSPFCRTNFNFVFVLSHLPHPPYLPQACFADCATDLIDHRNQREIDDGVEQTDRS